MSFPPTNLEALLAMDRPLRSLARSLVADAASADDLVQDAWRASLTQPEGEIHALGSWLAGAVRKLAAQSHRSRARVEEREHAAARSEALPSTHDLVAREEARRAVVAAVLALDEPYRATIVLRYFEDLPPRAIASRMDVPIETVRTREKRALARLRAELDARFRDRPTWMLILAPLARAPLAPIAPGGAGETAASSLPTLLAQLAIMSTPTKLSLGALVAVALGFFWWNQREADHGMDPSGAGAGLPTVLSALQSGDESPGSALVDAESSSDTSRTTAFAASPPEGPAASTGALALEIYFEDGTAAAGASVRLLLAQSSSSDFEAPEATADQRGALVFHGLSSGPATIQCDRGFMIETNLIAGTIVRERITLPRGFAVEGQVVNRDGAAVGGAQILLASSQDAPGSPCAISQPDGSFRIRDIGPQWTGNFSVHARARGYGPSLAQDLMAAVGATIELQLVLPRAGGAITGRVVDPDGFAVPGALVLTEQGQPGMIVDLADGPRLPGLDGRRAPPLQVRTDAAGSFTAEGLGLGRNQLVARARGWAPGRATLDVLSSATANAEIRLQPGFELVGVARDKEGEPRSGVLIVVGERDRLMSFATTDVDGAYSVVDLEPGEVCVMAHGRKLPRRQSRVRGSAGETVRWDPPFGSSLSLHGIVVDLAGAPLAGWEVRAHSSPEPADRTNYDDERVRTGADGRFVFEGLHPGAHSISTQPSGIYPALTLRGIEPGEDEVLLRVDHSREPSVRIAGDLFGEDGRAALAARVSPYNREFAYSQVEFLTEGSSRFDIGPYPPGEWFLRVDVDQKPSIRLGPRVLGPGETWDLGTIQLGAPGRVQLELVGFPQAARQSTTWRLFSGSFLHDWPATIDENLVIWSDLGAGDYVIELGGEGIAARMLTCQVRAGETTELAATYSEGWPCILRLAPFAPTNGWTPVRLTLTTSDDAPPALDQRFLLPPEARNHQMQIWMAEGTYTVELTAGEKQATGVLHVVKDASRPVMLEFALQ